MSVLDSLRLVGPIGSNKIMAGELSRLNKRALGTRLAEPKKAGTGALIYPFDLALAHLAASYHRTSSRVLWDLYASHEDRLEALYDQLRAEIAADQRPWLWSGAGISVRGRNLGDFAAGAMQVVGTVKNAIVDGARARGVRLELAPDAPDLLFALRMHDGELTVSIDLGGGSQHERGWRRDGGVAPLRENLAAALVMLARHDVRSEVLLDPMAGSGTIAIEAALLGLGAPLRTTPPALHRLPAFAGLEPARDRLFADARPLVVANEIDTRSVELIRGHAAAAGVAEHVSVLHGDFRDLHRERLERVVGERGGSLEHGVIVSNPPYGARLEREDPLPLYRDLGSFCRSLPGWRGGFLVANRDFEAAFGGRPRVVKPLPNASQPATFYLYDL
jgi:23S rRNA G2445 N2-methylase RlmL